MRTNWIVQAAACAAVITTAAWADSKPALEPMMCEPGKLLFSADFATEALSPTWNIAKGRWSVVDGALKGVELVEDNHGAVIRTDVAFEDAVIEFSFKLDGAQRTHLSINAARGHICRVIIDASGFQVVRDADKKAKVPRAVLGEAKVNFERGKWYTMLVEINGPEMLARVKNGPIAYGKDAGVDRPKANFGFPVSGDAAYFDNVKVWSAKQRADWPQRRAGLAALRGLETRWSGEWDGGGPRNCGEIECTAVQVDGEYWRATFIGHCDKIYTYQVEMTGRREGDRIVFKGDADLGDKHGIYHWSGAIFGGTFDGQYTDSTGRKAGVFKMKPVTEASDE